MKTHRSTFMPLGYRRIQYSLSIGILVANAAVADDVVSGRFELSDHHGRTVTESSFDGKLRLVFFGFTECPDVCPTTLFEIRRALQQLGDGAADVQTLFVSIDLENDTPEKVAEYVSAFHPSIVGLTGSAEQTKAAADSFNVTYGVQSASNSASGRVEVYHSPYVFLMGRKGEFLDILGYGAKAGVIVGKIRSYL